MEISKKSINDIKTELEFKLNTEDLLPHLNHAAAHLSQHKNIPGFRPGKAPLPIVEKHLGKETVFQDALEHAINNTIAKYLKENKIDLLEETDFKLIESKPDDVRFQLTLVTWPAVTLGDWAGKKIKRAKQEASNKELEKAENELAKMLVAEKQVDREAKKDDSALIDFDVLVDGKVIEGGVGRNFTAVIGENRMIPGFEEKLIGHKAGDEFTFNLSFPADYVPALAGKEAEFKIKVHKVFERVVPILDDEMAKKVGAKDLADLKDKLKANIVADKQQKEEQRVEIEAIKAITATAKIGTIADKIIENEIEKMLAEFEHELTHQGISLDDHLKKAGKNLDEIKKELKPKAIERVKTSLVIRQLADENQIKVDEKELEQELKMHLEHHASDPHAMQEIQDPGYGRYLASRLLNRKVIQFVKEKLVE